MISPRFAPAVAILAAIACIPTVVHGYVGVWETDGRRTVAIPQMVAGLRLERASSSARWVEALAAADWIERQYSGPGTQALMLTVARSYDPKRLYHHPEHALLYGNAFRSDGSVRFPQMPEVPVFVLKPLDETRPGLAVYSLLYDDRLVINPYLLQLRTAVKVLFSGRKQMTLFFVHEPAFPPNGSPARASSVQLLFAAIRSFLSQPRSP